MSKRLEMPNVGATELGLLIAGLGALLAFAVAVLTVVVLLKKLNAPPPAGSEFVTSAELDRVEARLKADIVNLDTYCRLQFHEFRDKLQSVENKIAVLPGEVRKVLDDALRPIYMRLDRGTVTMTRIAERLKIEAPDPGIGE